MDILAIVVLVTVGAAFPIAIWWRFLGSPEEAPGLRFMRAIAPIGDVAALALAVAVLV